jgi:hypothetical protein
MCGNMHAIPMKYTQTFQTHFFCGSQKPLTSIFVCYRYKSSSDISVGKVVMLCTRYR